MALAKSRSPCDCSINNLLVRLFPLLLIFLALEKVSLSLSIESGLITEISLKYELIDGTEFVLSSFMLKSWLSAGLSFHLQQIL